MKSSVKRRKGVERPRGGRRARCPSLCGERGVKGLEMKLETGAKTRSCRVVLMCKKFYFGGNGILLKGFKQNKKGGGSFGKCPSLWL